MRSLSALGLSSLLAVTVLTGCRVSSHKNGDNDNVRIGTPFGNMQVKTNDNVAASGLGITPYPGATLVKKHDGDHDNGAADVNMSFGSFHLGVKAVSYQSSDDMDTVLAFYKKDLGKYGSVLECKDNHAVGGTVRTAEGLTCDQDNNKVIHVGDSDEDRKTELRTGSKTHQHIVALEKKNGGTKIGLVSLDLPGNFGSSDSKDSE